MMDSNFLKRLKELTESLPSETLSKLQQAHIESYMMPRTAIDWADMPTSEEYEMSQIKDPKYSLAVRAVKAVLSRNSDRLKTQTLEDCVRNELTCSIYSEEQEMKDDVVEELTTILHWMHRRHIIRREEDPFNEGEWLWKLNRLKTIPKEWKTVHRGLATPEDTPEVPKKETDEEFRRRIEKEKRDNQSTYNPLADRVKRLEGQIGRYAETVGVLAEQVELMKKVRKVEYIINTNGKPVKIKEKVHKVFPQVLFHLQCGDIPMLVGPSGCGKTKLAMQVAEYLKKRFSLLSWHGGMTESQLYGKTIPNITGGKEVYIPADFADWFENGGLFLHDEIDGGDPNVLLSLNAPFSNFTMKLPRKVNPLIKMHKDFRCIATANTWGNGADRHYVGRNQMDGATVKRFTPIDMDYDEDLEIQLCPGEEEMVQMLQEYRARIIANKLQRIMDTRFILRAYNWKRYKKDDDFVNMMYFTGWREDEIRKVKVA